MRDAASKEISHVDLGDDLSFEDPHATSSAIRKIANKEQKIFGTPQSHQQEQPVEEDEAPS